METKEIEYYYTWKGLDSWKYRTYKEALAEVNKKRMRNVFPAGFEYEEEARAFCEGELDKYVRDNCRPFETEAEAVIYTDGSYGKDENIASYGLIIFFRDETEPYIESGIIEDIKGTDDVTYKIVRYDGTGNEIKDSDSIRKIVRDHKDDGKKGFVSKSQSAAGELSGVMRGLEICCKKRKLKNILIIYDSAFVEAVYNSRKRPGLPEGYAAVAYKNLLQDLKDADLKFIKIDSHSNKSKNKHQYLIGSDKYPHAVYNDLVDILARAEIGIKIKPTDNFNVFRAVSDEFERFPAAGLVKPEEQKRQERQHARGLVKTVLNKSDGIFWPLFSEV